MPYYRAPIVDSTVLHAENFVKRVDFKLSVLITKKGGGRRKFLEMMDVYYLACNEDFTSVCNKLKTIKLNTLNMFSFFCISATLLQFWNIISEVLDIWNKRRCRGKTVLIMSILLTVFIITGPHVEYFRHSTSLKADKNSVSQVLL